jgi:alpha-L-fucosidase
MTFNGSWGCMPYAPPEDWHSARKVVSMLQQVASGGGNLLLNIGPEPDGSVPAEAVARLAPVGRWLARYGEAVYGKVDATQGRFDWCPLGSWTRKGNSAYFWCSRWPGRELVLGGFRTRLRKAVLLANHKPLRFRQEGERLVLQGLPARNPDRLTLTSVIRLDFEAEPVQKLGAGCVLIEEI